MTLRMFCHFEGLQYLAIISVVDDHSIETNKNEAKALKAMPRTFAHLNNF